MLSAPRAHTKRTVQNGFTVGDAKATRLGRLTTRGGPGPSAEEAKCAHLARKVLGWPSIYTLAHAFLWEYNYKRLKLIQLIGRLGVFLAFVPSVLRAHARSQTTL